MQLSGRGFGPSVRANLALVALVAVAACQASLDLDRLNFDPDAPGGTGGAAGASGQGGGTTGGNGGTSGAAGASNTAGSGVGGSDAGSGAGGTTLLGPGATCGDAAECASSYCVDGACCAVEACEVCHSCSVPGSEGTCTPFPAGSDPHDHCNPGVCNADAACAVALVSANYGDAAAQSIAAIDVGPDGDIYIAGSLTGDMLIGDQALSALDEDVFVARLDPAGNLRWAQSFPGDSAQVVRGLAVGPSGEVALAGNFHGSVSFGGATLTSNGTGPYILGDLWVAKFEGDGSHIFSARYGSGADEAANDVAIDPDGNVILVGGVRGPVDFGGGAHDPVSSSAIFVAKLDPTGGYLWSRIYGQDAADETASAVATNSTGEIIVGGSYDGATLAFPPSNLHTSAGETDGFLVKLSAAGDVLWSDTLGGPSLQYVLELAFDAADNVVIGGQFFDSIGLGAEPLTAVGATDAFVTVRNNSGIFLWQRQIGGASTQAMGGVAVDPGGRVSVTGNFSGSINLGDVDRFAAGDGSDVYVATYAANGDLVHAGHYGDPNDQRPSALVASGDHVIVGGLMQGTMDFGNGLLTAQGDDAFFAILAP